MKLSQMTHIWPKLSPVRLPFVGKCRSINSTTRIFNSSARITGISSTRSWTTSISVDIPRAYLNFQNREKFRANHQYEKEPSTTGMPRANKERFSQFLAKTLLHLHRIDIVATA